MIPFVKAHACGNDFLMIESAKAERAAELARTLCDRNRGIGADGIEFYRITGERGATIRLFNADGSIAEISGNGTRCVAAWMAFEHGLTAGEQIELQTDAGPRTCRVTARQGNCFEIASGMGVPTVRREKIELASGPELEGAVVSTGNPHFVVFVSDVSFEVHGRSWESVGEEVCHHRAFPQQTNVEFVRLVAGDAIAIRIYERGVGPTSSSGTGTCAAAAAAIILCGAANALSVEAPGGTQRVAWDGGAGEMVLTGPAELIARGETF